MGGSYQDKAVARATACIHIIHACIHPPLKMTAPTAMSAKCLLFNKKIALHRYPTKAQECSQGSFLLYCLGRPSGMRDRITIACKGRESTEGFLCGVSVLG